MDPASGSATSSSRYVLPAWWVRAYESSMSDSDESLGAMELAFRAQLAPALSGVEMSALAISLDHLQTQILKNNSILTLKPHEHMRHAGITAKSKRFAFEKIIQLMSGLRVFATGDDASSFCTKPIFDSDKWVKSEDGEHFVQLNIGEFGKELLLGYANPFRNLLRIQDKQDTVPQFLRDRAPLSLWRSIWLDLQGSEQLLWLRMEQAMQWDYRWLQLDGVFGITIDQLFDGLKVPGNRAKKIKDSELGRRLKFLNRIGKKLVAHGFLTSKIGEQYLALSANSNENDALTLVWQVGRERLITDAGSSHKNQSYDYYNKSHTDAEINRVIDIFLAGQEDLSSIGFSLYKKLMDVDSQSNPTIQLSNNQVLDFKLLFWEWSVRLQSRSKLTKLPAGLVDDELEEILTARTSSLEIRVEEFFNYLEDNPEVIEFVKSHEGYTLFSEMSHGSIQFKELLNNLNLKNNAAIKIPEPKSEKPKLVQRANRINQDYKNSAQDKPVGKQTVISGALASRMLKLASEELDRMRKEYPDEYKNLRGSYLESLTDDERGMILEVKKVMQAGLFEDHLRQRIVKYMVDNPSSWRMSDPTAKLLKDPKSFRIQ